MASARIDGFSRPPDWSSPLPEQEGRAQVQRGGHLGQRRRVDDRGAHLGQLAFGQLRVGAEDVIGYDQTEDGITQELEPLVGLDRTALRAPRAMGDGMCQEGRVSAGPAQALRQRLQLGGAAQVAASSLAST